MISTHSGKIEKVQKSTQGQGKPWVTVLGRK